MLITKIKIIKSSNPNKWLILQAYLSLESHKNCKLCINNYEKAKMNISIKNRIIKLGGSEFLKS